MPISRHVRRLAREPGTGVQPEELQEAAAAHVVHRSRLGVDGLWCPASARCVADRLSEPGQFQPRQFSLARGKRIEPVVGEGLVAFAARRAAECVAVDSFGGGMTFNPQNWSPQATVQGRRQRAPRPRLPARRSSSAPRWTTTATSTRSSRRPVSVWVAFRSTPPSAWTPPREDPTTSSTGSRAQPRSCVRRSTRLATSSPSIRSRPAQAAPSRRSSVQADPGNSLSAISCKPSGLCVAVDRSGNAVAGSASLTVLATAGRRPGHAFNSVACPTSTECIAVDNSGRRLPALPDAGLVAAAAAAGAVSARRDWRAGTAKPGAPGRAPS